MQIKRQNLFSTERFIPTEYFKILTGININIKTIHVEIIRIICEEDTSISIDMNDISADSTHRLCSKYHL